MHLRKTHLIAKRLLNPHSHRYVFLNGMGTSTAVSVLSFIHTEQWQDAAEIDSLFY